MKRQKVKTIEDFDIILDAYLDKKISKEDMLKQCLALHKQVPECREYIKNIKKKGRK